AAAAPATPFPLKGILVATLLAAGGENFAADHARGPAAGASFGDRGRLVLGLVLRQLLAVRFFLPEDLLGPARPADEAKNHPLHGAEQHVHDERRKDELLGEEEEPEDAADDDARPDQLPD